MTKNEMAENETLSHYRVISFLVIALCMMSITSFYCFIEKVGFDIWICNYTIDILFFLAFIFQLEYERNRANIACNIETTYLRIAVGFGICTVITAGIYFLPAYVRPVLIFPIVMYAVCNTVISISVSLYFTIEICLIANLHEYEIALYLLMIVLGIIWVRALDDKEYHLYVCMALAVVSFILPLIFLYFETQTLEFQRLLYSGINSVIIFFICFFMFKRIRSGTVEEVQNQLVDVLSDSYPEVIELRLYSKAEYLHAITVSKACFECAKALGMRADLCAAAGFYYRMGMWKGEPHVQNGIFFAKRLCFPTELTQILSEYYGEERLPSTKESALVHIVDATVKKLQVLKNEATASEWNKELLIYQTLNDFSQSGIYDASGLSMNQFLQIRELLIKEEHINELLS